MSALRDMAPAARPRDAQHADDAERRSAETLPPLRPLFVDLAGEGLVAGLLGGSVVALVFLVIDLAAGRPLWTPSLLGSALFLGGAHADGALDLRMVLAYTGVHMSSFVAVGVAAAFATRLLERHPPAAFVLLFLFLVFETAFLGFTLRVAPEAIGTLGSAAVGIANLLAAGTMAAFFARRHPAAVRGLGRLLGWRS